MTNNPRTRELLRKAGAPEWYPEDAPRHETTANYDGEVVRFVCSICGYIRHVIIATGETRVINKGNPWAFHFGNSAPEIFRVGDGGSNLPMGIQKSLSSGLAERLFGFLKGG